MTAKIFRRKRQRPENEFSATRNQTTPTRLTEQGEVVNEKDQRNRGCTRACVELTVRRRTEWQGIGY